MGDLPGFEIGSFFQQGLHRVDVPGIGGTHQGRAGVPVLAVDRGAFLEYHLHDVGVSFHRGPEQGRHAVFFLPGLWIGAFFQQKSDRVGMSVEGRPDQGRSFEFRILSVDFGTLLEEERNDLCPSLLRGGNQRGAALLVSSIEVACGVNKFFYRFEVTFPGTSEKIIRFHGGAPKVFRFLFHF